MDLRVEVEHALEEMEWGEVVTTLTGAVHELLNGTTNPPSPPPTTPAPVSAGLEPNTQDGGYGVGIPVGAAYYMSGEQHPLMAAPTISDGPVHQEDIVQPGHLHCGAAACCQGQYLPYLWPVEDVPTAAGVCHPAAALPQPAAAFSYPAPPPQPVTYGPVVKLAEGQSLRFVGVLNGQPLYEVIAEVAAPPVYAAAPQAISNSKKRKRDSQQAKDRPSIKKPPNAFMLFLKEHRAKVRAEFGGIGSAEVNTILGQAWRSMTKEQQAKYFSQADKERLLQDNYKRKREDSSPASSPQPSTSDTQAQPERSLTPQPSTSGHQVNAALRDGSSSPQTSTSDTEECYKTFVIDTESSFCFPDSYSQGGEQEASQTGTFPYW